MIDPTTAVHYYGILSLVMATAMPLLFNFWFKSTSDLNTAGYKVGSYFNMIFAGPYVVSYVFFLLTGASRIMAGWLDTTMRISIAGPWFFNFYAIFVIFMTGLSKSTVLQWIMLVFYLGYSAAQMYFQFMFAAGVANFYLRESIVGEQKFEDWETPEKDT